MRLTSRLVSAAVGVSMLVSLALPIAAGAVSSTSSDNSFGQYSIEQIEQLIAKLQKQLAEMKLGSQCFVSDKDLSLGDGDVEDGLATDVRRLQDFLREKGYFKYKSTGYFGKATRTSVYAFQKASEVAQTGAFDAATRAKAHSLYCKGALAKKPQAEVKKEEKHNDEVKIEKAEEKKSGSVSSLSLRVDGRTAVWTVNGYSPLGFKVIWSKNSAPTYPTREGDRYQYFSSPTTTSGEALDAFSGSGTYRVRVCEYLGGKCGVYSNEVEVQL